MSKSYPSDLTYGTMGIAIELLFHQKIQRVVLAVLITVRGHTVIYMPIL
ncbi:hypothetical protein [Nostoc sp. ChiVER01]|nr:hypothetical protein [Nostoc sp. ChiVER01]MDZ8221828.1 hypothetical protein [Nostoc sp. ChiVER01]